MDVCFQETATASLNDYCLYHHKNSNDFLPYCQNKQKDDETFNDNEDDDLSYSEGSYDRLQSPLCSPSQPLSLPPPLSSSCCYDADASNDSNELNLSSSHDDSGDVQNNHHYHKLSSSENQNQPTESLHCGFGDVVACNEIKSSTVTVADTVMTTTASLQKFIPISEETVFLDPAEPSLPSISTSSPLSGDSWMNYSSNSSDDYSGISEQIKAVATGRQTGMYLFNEL